MIVRVRQPSGIRRDIDLGPAPARMKAQTFSVSAATVPNMVPVMGPVTHSDSDHRRTTNAEAAARYRAKSR